MVPIRDFTARLRDILDSLDGLNEDGMGGEDLEELNAEFEDALFMMDGIDPSDETWREELEDALEELDALNADYRRLEDADGALYPLCDQMDMAIQFIRGNM